MEVKKTVANFYRRPLPSCCIDFASVQGKALFKESLIAGNANIYFRLASQFLTQDEPAYCGLSTLVMVLNALDVDPGKVWKAPWRFYHESMLDCCLPLEVIKRNGITLPQFSCLASCNRLLVDLHYAQPDQGFLSTFRQNIKKSVTSDDLILVVSYDRKKVGQTGSGHFSPLGAYSEATDKVLIMDVARFKYPPHWVSLSDLHTAMLPLDTVTQRPRGYLLLKLRIDTRPLVVFSFCADADTHFENFSEQFSKWNAFLMEKKLENEEEELRTVCRIFKSLFVGYAVCTTATERNCANNECCLEKEMRACCRDICSHVMRTTFGQLIGSPPVTALLLSWPLQHTSGRSTSLMASIWEELKTFDTETIGEVGLLRTQIEAISAEALTRCTQQDSPRSDKSQLNVA